MSYSQKADEAELFDSLMTKIGERMADYPRLWHGYNAVHLVPVAGRAVYCSPKLDSLLQGPLSLGDHFRMIKMAERRSVDKPLCESLLADAATAWDEIRALTQRVTELEKALLSPEMAEPVIAKLLGLKEEE